jgi:MFS transporter, ACS family, aldohexuronate transporter
MSQTPSPAIADRPPEPPFTLANLRWWICGLLFMATTINYIDRQTIAVLKPYLQQIQHWSESDYGWIVFSFQLAYALMMLVSGKVIDWLGTRIGFALAMVWWSLAAMAHSFAGDAFQFGVARFFLGAGEAANFPASIKSVAEWFPKKERALATGIFNGGTNIGAWVGPLMVVWLVRTWSWREAFIFTGGLGFLWLLIWLIIYRLPRRHAWLAPGELAYIESDVDEANADKASPASWRKILAERKAWGFVLAKFMTDPIWWMYLFWLPSYLEQARGFSLALVGLTAGLPFLAADAGSIAGGWISSHLLNRGASVNRARKTAMAICAFSMPCGVAAVFASSPWLALALISVSLAAHQGWSANVFTLASDIFPKKDVGSVVGLGGAAGAVGGMCIAPVAGYILQFTHSYVPLFIIAGVMHPLAIILVHLIIPKIEPVTPS